VGGSLRDVQQLAGHASLGTTARYIESNQDAQRQPSGSCLSRLQIVYFVFPLLDPSGGVTARQEGTIKRQSDPDGIIHRPQGTG
jgi:hypothetical protein